jgi:hypothetical protein
MIPTQRTGAHDRLILADGHPYAGLPVTIVQAVGASGYLVRIGDDVTKVAPQYVTGDMLMIRAGGQS